MNPHNVNKYLFATLLIVVPGVFHGVFAVLNFDGSNPALEWYRTWYPVSMTAPFAFLALFFLAHCDWLKTKSRKSAYCGTIASLIAMSAVSLYLILNRHGEVSPTLDAISVGVTPFYYLPFLVFAYIPGAIAGMFYKKAVNQKAEE